MPLTTTGELVTSAAATHSALASFNVITLEHVEAVIAGAESVRAPVVLQVSENAVTFHGGHLLPLARAAVAAAEHAAVPVALHLDHVRSDTLLHQAADAGFSSVMYDAARLPYAENLAATRAAVDRAHAQGLWIEAELGQIGGKNGRPPLDAHAPGARTDPDEARVFVADSGVDALAVAIGSSHAMTTRTAALDHALLKRLSAALDVPLVLHGSSGVPDDELTAAVDRAHAQGLWIEAELGQIGGKNGRPPLDAHAPGARTDPDEARVFVADSGVDALAVAIGSSHAMTTRTAALDHALLKRLSAALDVPLVLHGSSGVPDDELTAAVAGGITKVNIGTALNIALTGAIRDFLAERPEAVDPRSYLTLGREAMTRAVARTLQTLGAATA